MRRVALPTLQLWCAALTVCVPSPSHHAPPSRPALPAGTLIGQQLQPVYAAATAGKPAAALQLPERLMQLLKVAGQHLYHNVPGGCTLQL